MLLHYEDMAHTRFVEMEEIARRHALARHVTAGRRWATMARFAERQCARARRRAFFDRSAVVGI
jgi:hypothetical protein